MYCLHVDIQYMYVGTYIYMNVYMNLCMCMYVYVCNFIRLQYMCMYVSITISVVTFRQVS